MKLPLSRGKDGNRIPGRLGEASLPLRLTVLGLALLAGAVARAEIEFVGILSMPPKKLFALTDTATDKTAWVSLGETFGEHKLTAYDAAADTVTLNKPGIETRIHLKDDAKI